MRNTHRSPARRSRTAARKTAKSPRCRNTRYVHTDWRCVRAQIAQPGTIIGIDGRFATLVSQRRHSAIAMVFCTVDQTPGSGGIARVSILIGRVLESRTISLLPPGAEHVTLADKLRFCSEVAQGQLRGEFKSLFFDHIGPASIQPLIPRSRRKRYGSFPATRIEVWRPLGPLSKRALFHADVRIANSEFTAEKTRAAHPGIGPIEVCPLGLPPDSGGGSRCNSSTAICFGKYACNPR